MKKLELQKCIVGSVYTNCYFLKNRENGELLIVDPGDAADHDRVQSFRDAGQACRNPSDAWSF